MSQSPQTSVYFTNLCETLIQVIVQTSEGSIFYLVYRTLTTRPALSLNSQAIRILYYIVIRSCALGYRAMWFDPSVRHLTVMLQGIVILARGLQINFD